MFDSSKLTELVNTYALTWGVNVFFALAILILGRMIAKAIVNLFTRLMASSSYDPMLVDFLGSILRALLMVIIVVAALDQLGVDTTSMIAVMGAAGLAVGLALQGSLQNFAAGVMLLVFRPFKSGDYVEAGGTAGSINKITIFNTIMTSLDNKQIIVPNGNIYKDNIVNYSAKDTRRIDMVFGIGYDSDLRKAKEILLQLIEADDRILQQPSANVAVSELADSSVNLIVRPWVATDNYWAVRFDFVEAVKLRFDREGIAIPFPQVDVHLPEQAVKHS